MKSQISSNEPILHINGLKKENEQGYFSHKTGLFTILFTWLHKRKYRYGSFNFFEIVPIGYDFVQKSHEFTVA